MSLKAKRLSLAIALFLLSTPAYAAINSGDTAWMLVSTALVMIMTPGLAFFYAGLVRTKNVVSTLYQNFIALGVIGVLWTIIGYSLAFSAGTDLMGDTSYFMLKGVGQEPVDANATIPHILFMAFQMMFAVITPPLMTGGFAERIRFNAWLVILVVWSLVIYSPVAHWVWVPTGWLAAKGALDFAGGFVVHMTAGTSALVAALMLGKRRDFGQETPSHDVGMILLGTTLLWFGWFGFNAGSALTAGGLASQAVVNTFIAAAVGMLAWTFVDNSKDGKPTLEGGCIGVVAGLVAITPAAGFVTAGSSMLIGLAAGVICNLVGRIVKHALNFDDTLDVFACHGVGGIVGAIMTGLLATTTVNSAGGNGLFYGDTKVFIANMIGVVAITAYSMLGTYIIIRIIGAITPLRVSESDEELGLDLSQHGERINSNF